jgi:soluble lytic murein transglycosylase-like protein
MKKICFVFVLTIVSVFSISAQTTDKSTDNFNPIENIKLEPVSTETVTNPVKTTDTTSKTDVSKESIKTLEAAPQIEPAKKPEALVSAAKKTLGALSTGNALIDGYIEEYCELYNVDPLLIYAQMNQESGFKGKATSSKGASGFMQLMPDTARRFGVRNIYNPKQNIQAGVKYMRWLLDKFGGDMRLALAGYNAGEGSVIKFGNKIPPYRETQNYVERIMTHYELIANQTANVAENEAESEK